MRKITQLLSILLCFVLLFEQSGFAQVETQNFASLHLSAHLASFHNTLTTDTYRPLHLRYLRYNSKNNDFNLLLDKGDFLKSHQFLVTKSPDEKRLETGDLITGDIYDSQLKEETNKLMEYFFIGLSLPNESFWVNLRPDSPDNIIDDQLAKTDIGKVLLEADVQLKKDTAVYTSPQTKEGKEYWDKLYKKAQELYGYDNITIPTLTRPWIVPNEIIIRETPNNAYIYKATLKVMLEDDYLSGDGGAGDQVSLRLCRNDTIILCGDIKDEWLKINKMISAGIIPSFQRVKECIVSSCLQNSKADVQEVSKSLCCIADILKLEEESLTPADSDMMELLVSLESCQLAF